MTSIFLSFPVNCKIAGGKHLLLYLYNVMYLLLIIIRKEKLFSLKSKTYPAYFLAAKKSHENYTGCCKTTTFF